MPPSPRYTVRLPPALDARVQARVQAGTPFAVLIREALSAYLADTMPTQPPTVVPTSMPTPADSADTVHTLQEQLDALTSRVARLEQALTRRRQPADTTVDRPADMLPTAAYDPAAAVARMQTLQAQGLSLAQIAAQLTAEGIPTRRGGPWQKGTVGYLLQQAGREG